MKSAWVEKDAQAAQEKYTAAGLPADLALRVYTTRLLGGDPKLVLHGGGNTIASRRKAKDMLGDEVDVLCVKGSGWDMGDIEPPGLPAVRLAPLRRLRALPKLSDEDMVNFQRVNLLDSIRAQSVGRNAAARVSAAQIRRSHALDRGARLDRPARRRRGSRHVRRAHGACAVHHPGLRSRQEFAEVYDHNPNVDGLILLRHGIFTFGKERAKRMSG